MGANPSHVDNPLALRRIEGKVRGVQRMSEERKYCIDILNQIYAIKVRSAGLKRRFWKSTFEMVLLKP